MAQAKQAEITRPPNDAERGILLYWLEQTKRCAVQLEDMKSPYLFLLDTTGELINDVLSPDEAG